MLGRNQYMVSRAITPPILRCDERVQIFSRDIIEQSPCSVARVHRQSLGRRSKMDDLVKSFLGKFYATGLAKS